MENENFSMASKVVIFHIGFMRTKVGHLYRNVKGMGSNICGADVPPLLPQVRVPLPVQASA